MCKTQRRKKTISNRAGSPFGAWSKYGSKQIISLLVVCLLALSPLLAIPGKAGLFQRATLTSQNNSQSQSLENSVNLNESQGNLSLTQEESLAKAKSSWINASANLDVLDTQMAHKTSLVEILKDSTALTLMVNDNLNLDVMALKEESAKKDGIIEELRGKKLKKILDVGGTYNVEDGFGLSTDIGLKYGIMTTKVGVQALLSDVLNPIKLSDIDTYTFRASVGLQW